MVDWKLISDLLDKKLSKRKGVLIVGMVQPIAHNLLKVVSKIKVEGDFYKKVLFEKSFGGYLYDNTR